jgi:hypothetical protein
VSLAPTVNCELVRKNPEWRRIGTAFLPLVGALLQFFTIADIFYSTRGCEQALQFQERFLETTFWAYTRGVVISISEWSGSLASRLSEWPGFWGVSRDLLPLEENPAQAPDYGYSSDPHRSRILETGERVRSQLEKYQKGSWQELAGLWYRGATESMGAYNQRQPLP